MVLSTDGHVGAAYELGGEPFTLEELAATVSEMTGRQVSYTDVPEATLRGILVGAGLPEEFAVALADADRGIAAGELYVEGGDLEKLIGHPATTLVQAFRVATSNIANA
ncbi:MAG: hypothetical protein ACT4QG_06630 [Sporichthyaceae bacterium]